MIGRIRVRYVGPPGVFPSGRIEPRLVGGATPWVYPRSFEAPATGALHAWFDEVSWDGGLVAARDLKPATGAPVVDAFETV